MTARFISFLHYSGAEDCAVSLCGLTLSNRVLFRSNQLVRVHFQLCFVTAASPESRSGGM